MKKNKIIIPAMAMILFSTAASISGTVAWFTANRVFNTEIGNFQVVEIDGSLDVTMAPGEGTLKTTTGGVNGIKVREDDKYFVSSDLVNTKSFVSGKEPTKPAVNDYWYNGSAMKKCTAASPVAWGDADLTIGDIYKDATEGTYFVAKTATTIVAIDAAGENFVSGSQPASPATNSLWYNGTSMKKNTGTPETPSWADAELTVGSVYHDTVGVADYAAIDATHIQPVSKNPAVLTHGSVSIKDATEGHAYVIDSDDTSSFIDRGVAATDEWLQRADVVLQDNTPEDQVVDVYNAFSWTMTFTYTFSSDSAPVGVYLDLAKSEFIDVATPTPDFTKNDSDPRKTSKGFRIGFYDESTKHDFVWGNNAPLTDAPATYTPGTGYAKGDVVRTADGNIYKAKAAIGSAAATLVADQWDRIGELPDWVASNPNQYKVGDRVLKGGVVYQCLAANNDATFTDANWENLSPAAPADYDPSGIYKVGQKVTHAGKTYKCTTDINSAENPFNPGHWAEIHDMKLDATQKFAAANSYSEGDVVNYNGQTYKAKVAKAASDPWDSEDWGLFDGTSDLRYVSGTKETTLHTAEDYVTTDHGYKRLDNLNANEKETWTTGTANAPERVCTLTTTNPSITIHCAAWFEGTDPNVVSGAAMECLKANMTFYARTVNAD